MAAETNLAPTPQSNSVKFWTALGMNPPAQTVEHPATPALHTYNGEGRKLSSPVTTDHACRAGIALFE